MKRTTLFIVLFLFWFSGFGKINFVEVKEMNTWEEILKLAKASQKSLFLYVEAYPCPECKTLKKTCFKDKELSRYVNDAFISVLIPNYSTVGKALISFYSIEEAPQLLVLNSKEDLFYKHAGGIAPDKLLAQLKAAEARVQQYQQWKMAFEKGKIKKLDWLNYLLVEHQNGRLEIDDLQVQKVSRTLRKADFLQPTVQEFVMTFGIDPDGVIFQTLKDELGLISDSEHFNWKEFFKASFNYSINKAVVAQDSVLLEDYLFQLNQLPKQTAMANLPLKGRQLYLAELNLWASYDSITAQYLHTLPKDSANAYQREALFLMENFNFKTPQKMALRYLAEGLKKKETFELYYTLSLFLIDQDEWVNAYKAAYNSYHLAKNEEQRRMAGKLMNYLDGGY